MPDTDRPLVSIIVCCHNRAHLLPETMASIFEQNYKPNEIIVFDDGSTDGTHSLMSGYGAKINYHWHENQGVSKARTAACRLARGEYIAFVDDDDLMPVDRISCLLDALIRFPEAIFATGDYEIIDADGNRTGQRWMPKKQGGSATDCQPHLIQNGHEAVLWPKTAATVHTSLFKRLDGEKISWFDPEYRFAAEDKDFFARLGLMGPVAYLPQIVSLYRRGHASLTSENLDTHFEQLKLFSEHIELIKSNRPFRQQLQKRLFGALSYISKNAGLSTKLPMGEQRQRIRVAKQRLPFKLRLRLYGGILRRLQS